MDFNEKLVQLRKQKNWTQEELAQALFVSRAAVSKWESGRGCPSIDSLKAISKLFSVSIDDLLSGEELMTAAETELKEHDRRLRRFFFGMIDCMPALLLVLPFFGQREGDYIFSVSLLRLTAATPYMRAVYDILTLGTVLFGIVQLALRSAERPFRSERCEAASIGLSLLSLLAFIVSQQPYASVFVLGLLVWKAVLLWKSR